MPKKLIITIIIAVIAVLILGVILALKPIKKLVRPPAVVKPYKVGIVHLGGAYSQAAKGMIDGMKDLGYVEGRDVIYYIRDTEGNPEATIPVTEKLLKEEPDMFYTISNPVTSRVWKTVEREMPIVFNIVGDPIGAGFAETWSSSETNLTGCSDLSAELSGKRLEVFKKAFPEIEKVVTFYDPADTFSQLSIADTRKAALDIGVEVSEAYVKSIGDLKAELAKLKIDQYDGIYLIPDAMVISQVELVVERAKELRIPTMGHEDTLAERGVTLIHGADFYDLGKQCAVTVAQVLRGQEPTNIPIQIPTKLEIVVNLKVLQEGGIAISQKFLEEEVHEVIE